MRRTIFSLSLALLATFALSKPATAQQAPTLVAPLPPASDNLWHFAISPRVWLRTNNIVSGPASTCFGGGPFFLEGECSLSQGALSFVMVGASLTLEPPTLQVGPHPTDVVITSYGGPSQSLSSSTFITKSNVPGTALVLGETVNAVNQGSRIDTEILARTALDPEGSVRAVYGLRWLRNDTTTTFHIIAPTVLVGPGHLPITTETDSLLGEGGMQFAVPIGPTPHSVFGGAILGFGNSNDVHSAPELFLDASVGYSYSLTPRLAPYLRYRFQVFAPFKGGAFTTNLEVVHGPELGFTLRF